MPGTLTITAKWAGAETVTAKAITGLKTFTVDTDRKMIVVDASSLVAPREFDINAATTFTVSISGGSYTVTIS